MHRPSPLGLSWAAAVVFLAVLALLAVQLATGRDPALRAQAQARLLPVRRVLLRRIYERKIVVHLPATAPPQAARSSQSVSASGAYAAGTPVTRTS